MRRLATIFSRTDFKQPLKLHRFERSNYRENEIRSLITFSTTKETKTPRLPPGYWKDPANHKRFFDQLYRDLHLKRVEDWYTIKVSDVESRGGRGLLNNYYGSSLSRALQTVYPEHDWKPWKFQQVSKGFWDDLKLQRQFFDYLAKELSMTSMEDWYKMKTDDIESRGGSGLLRNYYNSSHINALMAIYPEYPWKKWKFSQVPRGFWDDRSNVMEFLEWATNELKIKKIEDWYNISREQIDSLAGAALLQKYGNLDDLLTKFYPSHDWNSKLLVYPSKAQGFLVQLTKDIFPDKHMETDYRHPRLNFLSTNRDMELDIFLPDINLALEYQGQQHYKHHYLYGSPEEQQKRDAEKRELCQRIGLTLVEVPYWWDRRKETLIASIAKERPDLFPNYRSSASPIPEVKT